MRAMPFVLSFLVGSLVTTAALAEKGAPAGREISRGERMNKEHHDSPRMAASVAEKLSRGEKQGDKSGHARIASPERVSTHGVDRTACSLSSSDCRLRPTHEARVARSHERHQPTAVERSTMKHAVKFLQQKLCSQKGICGER